MNLIPLGEYLKPSEHQSKTNFNTKNEDYDFSSPEAFVKSLNFDTTDSDSISKILEIIKSMDLDKSKFL